MGGGDGDGGDHNSISPESSYSICDTDKPHCVDDNACRSFKLKDDKSLEIRPHACQLTAYRAFIRKFLAKLSVAGAKKLLINHWYEEMPNKQDYIPDKKGRSKKGTKKYIRAYKRLKKTLKQWKNRHKMILSALWEMANTKKNYLATAIGNMKPGVAAYNYLKTKLNPLENDEVLENAKALANFNNLELNTMKSASYEKL